MCALIVTGTAGGTWVISGPSGNLDDIQEYHSATFDQSILSRTDTSVTVKVTSKAVLETEARFPLDTSQLPADVLPHLEPTAWQQSDDPMIIEQAQALVGDAQIEAQATVAILDWVRANITYDLSLSLPTDAVSVYLNRSGVCSGFSNLAVALLRAAGIPARTQRGCFLFWIPHGGIHAWIEVYYPDVGWVPSEPQATENYVWIHLVSSRAWEWCGESSTNITQTENIREEELYRIATPYSDDIWHTLCSAIVPTWDRHPIHISTPELARMLGISETGTTASVEVESTHCDSSSWRITSSVPWISVSPPQGVTRTQVLVSINAMSLTMGLNTASITVTTWDTWDWPEPSKVIPVKVWIVENVHRTYLPLTLRAENGEG